MHASFIFDKTLMKLIDKYKLVIHMYTFYICQLNSIGILSNIKLCINQYKLIKKFEL